MNTQQQQPQAPVMPVFPINPKVSGSGVVTKKDGTVSRNREQEAISLLKEAVESFDDYWDKTMIDKIKTFLEEKK
jgi:hypothetical protein